MSQQHELEEHGRAVEVGVDGRATELTPWFVEGRWDAHGPMLYEYESGAVLM